VNEELAALEKKIGDTVDRWNMLPQGCTVVVGLSGGADSIALTYYLRRHAEESGIHMIAAHVNHELRGEEADRDERFVRLFCDRYGIILKILHADVHSIAREKSQGVEECGREVRYSFFRSLCGPDGRIATAHTLSDNAETVLMNLAKGAGAKGLCGIPPVRGNIVRPLIGITRAEVERYCTVCGLDFVTDSTNLTDGCARNKLRLRAVPALKEINPAFESSIERTTQILRCDEEYFEHLSEGCLNEAVLPDGNYRMDVLKQMPRAVLLRAIVSAVGRVSRTRLGFDHIAAVENVIRTGSGAVTVAGGIRCAASGNTLLVERQRKEPPALWSVPLSSRGAELPDGRKLELHPVPPPVLKNARKINNLLFNNLINYDTIMNTGGVVRNRRPGDAYRPAGRGVKKTLKKLFNEARIPVAERCGKAVLECRGEIVWAEGFGVSQEACVSEDSRAAAEIIIKECR
jgi:tRNA(Ile)-lysidine synthase